MNHNRHWNKSEKSPEPKHHIRYILKVPDVSDKIEMDVRVVELIAFPPTELTISNIFRGSF